MQKKCARCGRPIKEVGKLVKVTWLGQKTPLCKKCREEIKKKKGNKFSIIGIFRRFRR